MNKTELRKELMALLHTHDKQKVKFIDCEGCEMCEVIQHTGELLNKEPNPNIIKRRGKRDYEKIFEIHGDINNVDDYVELAGFEINDSYFYKLRKEYREKQVGHAHG